MAGCQAIGQVKKKKENRTLEPPKNRNFPPKKGTKIGFFSRKKFIFSYIYILNMMSSGEKGLKNGF